MLTTLPTERFIEGKFNFEDLNGSEIPFYSNMISCTLPLLWLNVIISSSHDARCIFSFQCWMLLSGISLVGLTLSMRSSTRSPEYFRRYLSLKIPLWDLTHDWISNYSMSIIITTELWALQTVHVHAHVLVDWVKREGKVENWDWKWLPSSHSQIINISFRCCR